MSLPWMISGERLQASGLQYARGAGVGGVGVAAGASEGEKEKKGVFSLVPPVGMVAVPTPAPLGDSRGSSDASCRSESSPHLFFTRRRRLGLGLFGIVLLLGRDGVAIQDDFFS